MASVPAPHVPAGLVVPLEPVRRELQVSNSRFIATLSPAESVEAARAFIQGVKAEFSDATHNVPAFVIGGGATVTEFCSDDGEPSGTSGRPLLAVLKGSGLGNAAVVVTRYFGGTLLGTGGLVKAYGDAGRLAVAAARRAELVPSVLLSFSLPYALYERLRRLLEASGAALLREDFAEAVSVDLELPAQALSAFLAALADLGSGGIVPAVHGEGTMRRPL